MSRSKCRSDVRLALRICNEGIAQADHIADGQIRHEIAHITTSKIAITREKRARQGADLYDDLILIAG